MLSEWDLLVLAFYRYQNQHPLTDIGVNICWSKWCVNGIHNKQVQFAAFMFLFCSVCVLFTWMYTTHPLHNILVFHLQTEWVLTFSYYVRDVVNYGINLWNPWEQCCNFLIVKRNNEKKICRTLIQLTKYRNLLPLGTSRIICLI